ncbi:unnamed protein product, partial [Phaeothamnion confervicola]
LFYASKTETSVFGENAVFQGAALVSFEPWTSVGKRTPKVEEPAAAQPTTADYSAAAAHLSSPPDKGEHYSSDQKDSAAGGDSSGKEHSNFNRPEWLHITTVLIFLRCGRGRRRARPAAVLHADFQGRPQ